MPAGGNLATANTCTASSTSDISSIRSKYVQLGVQEYYQSEGENYSNPHEQRVVNLLNTVWQDWDLPMENVLDLATGNGEVTNALINRGVTDCTGCDPFTYRAFEKRLGRTCLRYSFEDIIEGCFSDRRFRIVVCSYAMHLASDSKLPVLALNLALSSHLMLILTPHKRPVLKEEWGWILDREMKIERTKAVLYRSLFV